MVEGSRVPSATPPSSGGAVSAAAWTGVVAGTGRLMPPCPGSSTVPVAVRAGVVAGAALLSAMLAAPGAVPAAVGEPPPPAAPLEGRPGARPTPQAVVGQPADGGRDPFVRPAAPESPAPVEGRPPGLAGLDLDEAVLRGVVASRGGRLAVIEGPDARTWVVRRGGRLYDGAVREIAADAVVFLRDAADSVPFAERVVRKRLHGTESGR